jgi:hypothetical protein
VARREVGMKEATVMAPTPVPLSLPKPAGAQAALGAHPASARAGTEEAAGARARLSISNTHCRAGPTLANDILTHEVTTMA